MYLKKLLATACIAALPSFASGTTVPVTKVIEANSDWNEFRFSKDHQEGGFLDTRELGERPNGVQESAEDLGVLTFSFSLTGRSALRVTDGWLDGDRFELYLRDTSVDNSVFTLLGQTSKFDYEAVGKGAGGDNIENEWEAAFHNDLWSSGKWYLEAGHYELTGKVIEQPVTLGRGAVSLSAVPLPASFMFMLSAFGGCFAFSRYRNKKVSEVA
ncbi:hypothetical protein [Tateyamaria sp. Alg231-49]|uniref:hypothetical protein n=1 Tax=Tateyamaria sp. Alg231-49 TaxID=1922219 RepID=UPI000D5611A8|nr:hypothetical protein [Tateyamaria sp. Alg231-49]